MRQKLFTFILMFLVWVILAGRISKDVIIVGTIVSAVTTLLFSDMLFRLSNRKVVWVSYIRRLFLIFIFIPVFFYEVIIAALKVSRHVFEKKPSFSPGIVRVKTNLRNVSALTLMANLITLTPGTLTLDFDRAQRAYYIHWIDVKSKEDAIARREIISRFEDWLGVIFK